VPRTLVHSVPISKKAISVLLILLSSAQGIG
jgi:hypothetical protein